MTNYSFIALLQNQKKEQLDTAVASQFFKKYGAQFKGLGPVAICSNFVSISIGEKSGNGFHVEVIGVGVKYDEVMKTFRNFLAELGIPVENAFLYIAGESKQLQLS